MNQDFAFHARRKLVHILTGSAVLLFVYFDIISIIFIAIFLLAGVLLSLICKYHRIPVIYHILEVLDKREDLSLFPGRGAVMFLFGITLVLVLFPRDIALASIAILTFGDSVSALYGIAFGVVQHPFSDKKSVEGNIAGGAAAFMIALLFVSVPEALFASFIAMLFEAVEPKSFRLLLDDNLIVPLISGAVIMFMRFAF